jgi:hypothetical protein
MPLALRHRRLLQVLLVDHGLQGGVHVVGERLAVVLHSAGGGQLGRGGVCAEQVAQVQRVVAVADDMHHVIAGGVCRGQQDVGGAELEVDGFVGRCRG